MKNANAVGAWLTILCFLTTVKSVASVIIVTGSGSESSKSFAQLSASINSALSHARRGPVRVALDCEGVNMSRHGSLELVTLHFEPPIKHAPITYIVEVGLGDAKGRDQRLKCLKRLLASFSIEKVVHDCRTDSDCLRYFCGIPLVNVHDTSCFEQVIRAGNGKYPPGLDAVAKRYGLRRTATKNTSIYKTNPSFWATRPLTEEMIKWATEDVDRLLAIARLQDDRASEGELKAGKKKSNDYANLLLSMKSKVFGYYPGEKKKLKLNSWALQSRTGTRIYRYSSETDYSQFIVYYKTKKQLAIIEKAMGNPPPKSSPEELALG